jgi:hypothetical protein
VVTDRAQLLAVARSSGRIRWISQLPRYHNERKREGPIYWRGPVLAGNRLILTGSNGNIIYASPVDGTIQTTVEHHTPMSLPPIVSNSTLLILDNDAKLTAGR